MWTSTSVLHPSAGVDTLQDLLVASLFRNFLLAERIMAASNCTPVSYPRLPPTHQHPMWQAWDLAAEMCLLQVSTALVKKPDHGVATRVGSSWSNNACATCSLTSCLVYCKRLPVF